MRFHSDGGFARAIGKANGHRSRDRYAGVFGNADFAVAVVADWGARGRANTLGCKRVGRAPKQVSRKEHYRLESLQVARFFKQVVNPQLTVADQILSTT
jgi:hypothetical protein